MRVLAAFVDLEFGDHLERKLVLRQLILGNETKNRLGAKASLTGPSGRSVGCAVKVHVNGVQVDLADDLTIREGEMATLTVNG